MEGSRQSFDICILCALYEEASAVIDEFATRCKVTFTQAFRALNRLEYYHSTIENERSEPLTVFITWLSEMGPIRTALDINPLLREINPRFVAMTGMCAGDRRKVRLGDLIVATSAYHPDEGKIIRGANRQSIHLPATGLVSATAQVVQYVQSFAGWREPVRELRRQQLKRPWKASDEPRSQIGVMASSMAVRADDPFPALTTQYHRKTIGIDMEAATFYTALRDFPFIHGLVVKGVSDHGDRRKGDRYRDYARRASAIYMLRFIQEYVTDETMPHHSEAPPPPVFVLPMLRDPFFTGRDELLQALFQQLTPGSAAVLNQAISGMGGIGKTHAALEYAYRYRSSYTAVLWLLADSWENVLSGCFVLNTALGLSEEQDADRVLVAVQRWLREHQRWLLILDNVEQVQEIMPRLLPAGYQGSVLITTRIQHIEPFARTQLMDTMSEKEGVLFLFRRAALIAHPADLDQSTAEQYEAARQIWELLGGLPLALDQAGAYILETGCAFAAYGELYNSKRAVLLDRRGWRFVGHETSVAATLSLAVEQVVARAPLAAEILKICALLDGGAIPEELFTQGAQPLGLSLLSDLSMNEAFGVLQDYSLVQRNRESKLLSIHRLVQAVLQDEMGEAERQQMMERVVMAVNQLFPHAEPTTWPQCERMLPQALLVAQYIEAAQMINEQTGRLLHELASYLQSHARYVEAESFYRLALKIRRQYLGPEHPDVAASLNSLGNLYREQSKYDEAESLYLLALNIREKALGPEHPEVAASLSNLAEIYREQSKYDEAESLYLQTRCIREQQLGPDHPDVATSLNNLAILYRMQNRYTEAEPLYRRALQIWEQQWGSDHLDVAYPLNGLAILYKEQGKYAEAEPLYQRVLTIREHQLGANHPLVADSLNNLAELYGKQGKYSEAKLLYQRALHIYEQQWGPEHLDIAYLLIGLADLYSAQEKYDEAELFYQRALSIREHALVPFHSDIADTLFGFATLRAKQGNYLEAISLYRRALKIRRRISGSHHKKTIEVQDALRAVWQMLGRDETTSRLEIEQLEQEDL